MARNVFNSVPVKVPKRNLHNLSHTVTTTGEFGRLIPFTWFEAVPGDSFRIKVECLLRFQPLIAPVFHRYDMFFHWWFVPRRLLWADFGKFIGDLETTPAVVHPYLTWSPGMEYRLGDYLGLPPITSGGGPTYQIDAMVPATYQRIFQECYRDENLQKDAVVPGDNFWENPFMVDAGSNDSSPVIWNMHDRAWAPDYFTKALPFAQKGQAVNMPVGDFQDVQVYTMRGAVSGSTTLAGTPDSQVLDFHDSDDVVEGEIFAQTSALNESTGAPTINDLRRAMALQRFMEALARGGTRFTEYIRNVFGVIPPDYMLQRPHFIGGTKSPVTISEIVNTTGEIDGLPQGNMSGHGVSFAGGNTLKYRCVEHGIVMGIVSVMPRPAYQQGIHRSWFKSDLFSYLQPHLQHIGEQEVFNKELMADRSDGLQDGTFGWIPRYSEYRFLPNRISGDFRTSLDFWTGARIFDPLAPPALNEQFIRCVTDNRQFAVQTTVPEHLLFNIGCSIGGIRPLAKYGVPI